MRKMSYLFSKEEPASAPHCYQLVCVSVYRSFSLFVLMKGPLTTSQGTFNVYKSFVLFLFLALTDMVSGYFGFFEINILLKQFFLLLLYNRYYRFLFCLYFIQIYCFRSCPKVILSGYEFYDNDFHIGCNFFFQQLLIVKDQVSFVLFDQSLKERLLSK